MSAGPFESMSQAASAARKVTDGPPGSWDGANRQLLEEACTAAGVELGTYDRQVIAWVGTWEPWMVAVIAGLITRAARPEPVRPMCADDIDIETGEAYGADQEAECS